MKLELKHLAPYLPYEFKFISEMDKPYNEFGNVRVWTADGIIKLFGNFCLITSENNDAYDINFSKPILFPLSSLTKEITINGETFVPVDIICPKEDYKKEFDRKVDIGSIEIQGAINFSCTAFCIVEKLFEWKFDVFGLIEEGLAEPVTEDFNPYK